MTGFPLLEAGRSDLCTQAAVMAEAGVGFVGCVKRDLFFAIFKFSWSALQTRLGITVGYLHGQGLSHPVRIFDRFCASMSGAHHFLSSLLYVVCIFVYQYGGTVMFGVQRQT